MNIVGNFTLCLGHNRSRICIRLWGYINGCAWAEFNLVKTMNHHRLTGIKGSNFDPGRKDLIFAEGCPFGDPASFAPLGFAFYEKDIPICL